MCGWFNSQKVQAEIDLHMHTNVDGEILRQAYKDFEYLDFGLDRDFQQFKQATVDPIWNLRCLHKRNHCSVMSYWK